MYIPRQKDVICSCGHRNQVADHPRMQIKRLPKSFPQRQPGCGQNSGKRTRCGGSRAVCRKHRAEWTPGNKVKMSLWEKLAAFRREFVPSKISVGNWIILPRCAVLTKNLEQSRHQRRREKSTTIARAMNLRGQQDEDIRLEAVCHNYGWWHKNHSTR